MPRHFRPRRFGASAGMILLLATCPGCKDPSSSNNRQNPAAQPATNKTCLAIVDGQTTAAYPATYLIVALNAQSGEVMTSCTGSFVGDNVLVTAAHCIPSAPSNLILLGNQQSIARSRPVVQQGIRALRTFTDPQIQLNPQGLYAQVQGQDMALDIAVVLFPDHTATTTYQLPTASTPSGTPVTLVGYGSRDVYEETQSVDPGSIVKFAGVNTVANPNPTFPFKGLYQTFAWGHPGEAAQHGQNTSSGAPGDSGGPLLVGTTLIGTTKFGFSTREVPNIQAMIGTDTLDFYVDVTNPTATALFKAAAQAGGRISYAGAQAAAAATPTAPAAAAAATPCK